MYTCFDYKTKKDLKQALAQGRKIGVFQPGPFGGNEPTNGTVFLEGPHYPAPHKWYAQAEIRNGYIVSIK